MNDEKVIEASLQLDYPGFRLEVDVKLPCKGVTAIFGHSGSGKTSLLRCIAGLNRARGMIKFNGETWQNDKVFVAPHKRPIGYVFQEASLFAHLSVERNLKYGLRRNHDEKGEECLKQAIELLGIGHLLNRKPTGLSGGERQRVAIARALAVNPKVLLMDEPLASLDKARKKEFFPFIKKLHDQLSLPILYVSHSTEEVSLLADHLVVMDHGTPVACGPLATVLSNLDLPMRLSDEFGTVIPTSITEIDQRWNLAKASFNGSHLWIRNSDFSVGDTLRVQVLARDVSLATAPPSQTSIVNILKGRVEQVSQGPHDSIAVIKVQVSKEHSILAHLTRRSVEHLKLEKDKIVWLQIKSAAMVDDLK